MFSNKLQLSLRGLLYFPSLRLLLDSAREIKLALREDCLSLVAQVITYERKKSIIIFKLF